jgi:hypothetical protein
MYGTSNDLEAKLLNQIFLGQPYTPPSKIAIALTKNPVQPNQTGSTINEIDGSGYARKLVNTAANAAAYWEYNAEWHKQEQGTIRNKTNIPFNTAISDWGMISGVAILDNEGSGLGNVLFFKEINPPRMIYAGETVKFNPYNFGISIE